VNSAGKRVTCGGSSTFFIFLSEIQKMFSNFLPQKGACRGRAVEESSRACQPDLPARRQILRRKKRAMKNGRKNPSDDD